MKTSANVSTPIDFINPDKNVISLLDTDILMEVANGKIDLTAVAIREFRKRELDKNGKWIGYH